MLGAGLALVLPLVYLRSLWDPLCHATPEFIRNKLQTGQSAFHLHEFSRPHTHSLQADAEAARHHTLTKHTCSNMTGLLI